MMTLMQMMLKRAPGWLEPEQGQVRQQQQQG
jgi:hypothetical protein